MTSLWLYNSLLAVEKDADETQSDREEEEEDRAMKELYEAIGYAEGEHYEYPREVSLDYHTPQCVFPSLCAYVHVPWEVQEESTWPQHLKWPSEPQSSLDWIA